MNKKGFSLIEVLGVVGVILILAVLSIPAMRNMSEGSKASVASRNAASLNSAVQQYDQLGGLMTAQVFSTEADPELKVLNLLRSAIGAKGNETGQLIASWQEPIIATSGPRVVWVNGLADVPANRATKSASGARNAAAEQAIRAGTGGRFEVITDGTRPGIVGFRKGNLVGPTALATPTPGAQKYDVSLVLSPASAGTVKVNGISGKSDFNANDLANVVVTLNAGFVPKTWDAETSALLGNPKLLAGSFKVTRSLSGTLYVEKGELEVNLSANPANGGSVSGSGAYKIGDSVSYTAVPAAGWKFTGWASLPGSLTDASGTLPNLQNSVKAVANFTKEAYDVTIGTGVGGVSNVAPGVYSHAYNDKIQLDATPTWADTWGAPRYRWDKWLVGSSTESEKSWTYTVTAAITIAPKFVRQYKFQFVEAVNPAMGDATSALPDGIYDTGTKITLSATPKDSGNPAKPYGFRRWEVSKDGITWSSLGAGQATFEYTLTDDSKIRAVFTDVYTLEVLVMDETSAVIASNPVDISGVSLGVSTHSVNEEIKFDVSPKAGWVFVRVDGIPVESKNSDLRLSGGSVKSNLLKDTVVQLILKPRPLVAYWNDNVNTNNGAKYPVPKVTVNGASFASAKALGGITDAYMTATLQSVNVTTSSVSSGGAYQGPATYVQGAGEGSHGWWVGNYYYDTYVYTYYGARSANVVILDADTGEALVPVPYLSRKTVGESYASVGKVMGTAIGSEGVVPSSYSYPNYYSSYSILSPLLIDLDGDGLPNLLAGMQWGKTDGRKVATNSLRKFKMDGKNALLWEWVGGKDGLLVWNPEHKRVMDVTGGDLFGNVSFGKSWENGYKALASLDANLDGVLSAVELDDIYVWQDKNSDAVVQEGELRPSKDYGIEYLAVSPDLDADENASVVGGAQLTRAGEQVAITTWDWISYGGLPIDSKLVKENFLNSISEYTITSSGKLNGASLGFAPTITGLGVFWCVPPNEFSDVSNKFVVVGDKVSWSGIIVIGTKPSLVSCTATIVGEELKGEALFESGEKETWSGKLKNGVAVNELSKLDK